MTWNLKNHPKQCLYIKGAKMAVSKGKAKKILSKSFVENHANISHDEAADLIVEAEIKIKHLLEEKAEDEKLNAAKQIAKDLNGAYNSTIQYEKAKISFLLDKIEEIKNDEVNPTSGLK